LDFAIVDEVDSILIDEARTPLVISGPSAESSDMYLQIKKIIPKLKLQLRPDDDENPLEDHEIGHYLIDEKNRTVELTDDGYVFVEQILDEMNLIGNSDGLYSVSNLKIMRFVQASLRANFLFKKNVDYLVRNNEVVLIDEHTGRTMPGRRISEGVHQALESKENVPIQKESQTLASTTFQNFFRLFKTLSGMTGTADTEALEFSQIYGLDVVVIPTNKPMVRNDNNDLVFLTKSAKYKALIKEVEAITKNNGPVLIGTVSVESSEEVSSFLKKSNINHQILNAKHHEREAEVIANAGKPGVVTIATNMAGRGTDIVLGGKKEDQDEDAWLKSHKLVLDAGGLHILGTERHESRRIDNQLRGRSGRQGDPGYSKFFLSLEDDLLRLFITDSRRALFEKIGMGDEPIEHRMLSRGIENAQRRIEARNFDARKNLLEYDDVANDQRQAIYTLRNQLLNENDISLTIENNIEDTFTNITSSFIPLESVESQWKHKELEGYLLENFNLDTNISKEIETNKKLNADSIPKYIVEKAKSEYINKFQKIGESLKLLEKQIMLQVLDVHWKEHLAEIDHLRASIGLRAYAQKNPKNEYKREAYALFEEMLNLIDTETIRILFNLKLQAEENIPELKPQNTQDMTLEHASPQPEGNIEHPNNKNPQPHQDKLTTPLPRLEPTMGRNDFVKITNGKETKELKYKKAQSLIETGEWKII
ncbi:MAG: preprotein translocase subunit SecA, partial [Gammaproteobacteria bacterium]